MIEVEESALGDKGLISLSLLFVGSLFFVRVLWKTMNQKFSTLYD